VAECRSCDAPIVWARTQADKSMPIDAEPVADGNIVFTGHYTAQGVQFVRYLKKGEEPSGDRYVSHFATCKDSSSWRR